MLINHVLTLKFILVPEIFRKLGFVFFFYTNEGQEPMHVHVRKAGGFAKFWVEPVDLDFSQGMKISDIKKRKNSSLNTLI